MADEKKEKRVIIRAALNPGFEGARGPLPDGSFLQFSQGKSAEILESVGKAFLKQHNKVVGGKPVFKIETVQTTEE